MEKIKSRLDLINMIVKPIFWVIFVIGLGIISIGIAQFIMTGIEITNQVGNLSTTPSFSDVDSAIVWTENISTLIGKYNNNFQFILLGILVAFISRITSKPLLMGGTFFAWISTHNLSARRGFKGHVVLTIIFLLLSLLLGILSLFGLYRFLLPVSSIISGSQVIVERGIDSIKNLPPDASAVEINNQMNLIINSFQESLGNLKLELIINKSIIMFILFVISIILWGFVELTHGIVVLVRRKRLYNI